MFDEGGMGREECVVKKESQKERRGDVRDILFSLFRFLIIIF